MNRCGTCKHYKEDEETKPFGVCERVAHDDEYVISISNCIDEEDRLKRDKFAGAFKACVHDGSGYYAALLCQEDFGCVLWEAGDE